MIGRSLGGLNAYSRRRRRVSGGIVDATGPVTVLDHNFVGMSQAAYDATDLVFTGTTARTHFNSSGVLTTLSSGTPRLASHVFNGSTWDDHGLGQWRAYTNLCLESEDLETTWALHSGGPTIGNAITAPDGTTTMLRLTQVDESFDSVKQQITLSTSTVYNLSIYTKTFDSARHEITVRDTPGNAAQGSILVSWSSGVPSTFSSDGATQITYEDVGNDIYRISFTFTSDGTNADHIIFLFPNVASIDTLGCHFWGVQLTQTDIVLPYISTTTAAVAVSADIHTQLISTISGYNQSAVTFVINASFQTASATAYPLFVVDDGSANDRFYFERDASENINFATINSGDTNGASDSTVVIAVDTNFKVSGAAADDDVRAAVDGTLSPADTSAGIPLTSASTIVRFGSDGTLFWDGYMARAEIVDSRLDDGLL